MTHLIIQQDNTVTEEVTSKIIERLYNAVHDSTLDNTSQLVGRLHTTIGYLDLILYLNTMYPGLLYILADDYSIKFEDPKMLYYLNSIGVGGDGYVTTAQAAAKSGNFIEHGIPYITKFNELKYFTNYTQSKGGINGGALGHIRFDGWTSLQEVDISNFVSLGHYAGAAYSDTFRGCSSLTNVKASDKLVDIGYCAFLNCSSLTNITDLSGDINVYAAAFCGCTNLPSSVFLNVTITPVDGGNRDGAFKNCSSLTSIVLNSNAVSIPQAMFRGCTNLSSINLSNIRTINKEAFYGCTSLQSVDLSNVNVIGDEVFRGCTGLTTITGTLQPTNFGSGSFRECTNLLYTFDFSLTTSISNYTFMNCKKCTFINVDHLSSIGTGSFSGCETISTLSFGNNASIGVDGFKECKYLQSVTFGGGCNIGSGAFMKSGISSITFNGDCILLPRAFLECKSLTSVDLTNISEASLFVQYQSLLGGQFGQCTLLRSATLNPTLTRLPDGIFGYLGDGGFSITLPATITELGANCFYGTRNLDLTCLATTPPTLNNLSIYNVSVIRVPQGTLSAYLSAPGWSNFAGKIIEIQ